MTQDRGKTLLVTGGCGFIGTNLVRFLLNRPEGWRVVNVDSLTYAGNRVSLAAADDNPNFRFVHGDVRNAEAVDAVEAILADGVDATMGRFNAGP